MGSGRLFLVLQQYSLLLWNVSPGWFRGGYNDDSELDRQKDSRGFLHNLMDRGFGHMDRAGPNYSLLLGGTEPPMLAWMTWQGGVKLNVSIMNPHWNSAGEFWVFMQLWQEWEKWMLTAIYTTLNVVVTNIQQENRREGVVCDLPPVTGLMAPAKAIVKNKACCSPTSWCFQRGCQRYIWGCQPLTWYTSE